MPLEPPALQAFHWALAASAGLGSTRHVWTGSPRPGRVQGLQRPTWEAACTASQVYEPHRERPGVWWGHPPWLGGRGLRGDRAGAWEQVLGPEQEHEPDHLTHVRHKKQVVHFITV